MPPPPIEDGQPTQGSICVLRDGVEADADGYLTAPAGTVVTILHAEDGWFYGRTEAADGWFPATAPLELLDS